MNEQQENAVIACEIKIGVTANSFAKIQELIERLRKQIEGNYTLKVSLSGEVLAKPVRMATLAGTPNGGCELIVEDLPTDF